jgi:hypothetical protein
MEAGGRVELGSSRCWFEVAAVEVLPAKRPALWRRENETVDAGVMAEVVGEDLTQEAGDRDCPPPARFRPDLFDVAVYLGNGTADVD